MDTLTVPTSRRVFISRSYQTTDREDIFETLSWFSAVNPDIVFHKPINPRGETFEMLVDSVQDAGFEEAARKFESLLDTDMWVEYVLDQINMTQEEAKQFDDLTVHTWPDRRLVDKADRDAATQLRQMRKAVSSESFIDSSDIVECQSPLSENNDTNERNE